MKMIDGVCHLCGNLGKLENSHIIPKFIFKWLKETGTGKLRASNNMNQRVQDGIKVPFLCGKCEDLFSKSETYFSKNIFYPIVEKKAVSFEYNDKLFYFVISVLWRLLRHSLLEEEKGKQFYEVFLETEKEWRNYLLTGKSIDNFGKMHLLIGVDFTEGNEHLDIPSRFIQYMGRFVDAGGCFTEDECMLFLKLPRFIFITPLKGFDDKMINTTIHSHGGNYEVEKARIENTMVGTFFFEKVKIFNEIIEKASPSQRSLMREAGTGKNWDKMKDKDLRKIVEYERKILE